MSVPQPTWLTSISSERPIIGQELDVKRRTTGAAIAEIVESNPNRVQYVSADGNEITLSEFYKLSSDVAKAAIHLGLKPFEGVGILAFNSVQWFATDTGATFAGGIPAGIYTTNKPDVVAYILNHSNSRLCFVDDEDALQKVLSVKSKCENLQSIIIWGDIDLNKYPDHRSYLYTWQEFIKMADEVSQHDLDARLAAQKPEHVCKLIYTSGTTGPPKAVMISHDNVVFTCQMTGNLVQVTPDDILCSFLPCSHIAANSIDISGALINGYCVHLARPDALKGSLVQTLKQVRPTVFAAVPRVYEKIQEKMLQIGATAGPVKRAISAWAKGVGTGAAIARDVGDDMMPWGYRLADMVVFANVRKALGLDRCRLLLNTAAPMQAATDDYFRSLNFRIIDLYGMSEATGPLTVNWPGYRRGTSGKPLPGIDVKLHNKDETDEGELCFRGRNIFVGYLDNDEETSKTIDEEGYIHSGDLGRVDADGFVKITGRAKELIVTAGGENVAPALVESTLISAMPAISRAFAIGDLKKFISCMLVPYMDEQGNLIGPAIRVSPKSKTGEEAKADPVWKQYIDDGIARANEHAISNAAKVKKYTMLTSDFTVETGELTPTMKVKRKIVVKNFNDVIDAIYATA